MPQKERHEEKRARDIVAARVGVQFEFTDHNGGIDYASLDGGHVLEVTRYTDPRVRRDMAVAADSNHALDLGTGYDWWVSFDGYPDYRELAARLYDPLRTLETHGLVQYNRTFMDWWMPHLPSLRTAAQGLQRAKVLYAKARPTTQRPSRLFVMSTGGYTYGGPDAALELLQSCLADDVTHVGKLTNHNAAARHLFAWTDAATPDDLRAAFALQEERLPGRRPELPEEVTDLWVVDEILERGWHWSAGENAWEWILTESGPGSGPDSPPAPGRA